MYFHQKISQSVETILVTSKSDGYNDIKYSAPKLSRSIIILLKFRIWFKYGLKAQKLQKQHALKGQKLLAQGSALGIIAVNKTPYKGKSFVNCLIFLEAFALTGRQTCVHVSPGRCPGLGASALSGRVEPTCKT